MAKSKKKVASEQASPPKQFEKLPDAPTFEQLVKLTITTKVKKKKK